MNELIEKVARDAAMKERAEDFVNRISYMTDFYYGILPSRLKGIKPVIFLSPDIMHVLANRVPNIVEVHQHPPITTIFGYEAKLARGENVLYVGFEI